MVEDKGSDSDEEYENETGMTMTEDRLHLLKLELCSDPQARVGKLIMKYKHFRGFSLLRARVSWVIGHSKLYHQRNFYHSEKYFFESLYTLKKLCKFEFFPLNSTMQTELASLVLIDYADVLLENKKYQYAIHVLEKVIECLGERQKNEAKFQIVRKLCITCTEKEDWNRAIKYHDITLKKLKDTFFNLNEFVYLSQQISTIHLKLNNFNQAEKELQNGIKTIYLNVLSYHNKEINIGNIHNIDINKIFEYCEGEEKISIGSLILVLANLYISGGNYLEIAINLLTYLRKHIFTSKASTRRILILFQLARAYFKHGKYDIAYDIIEKEILIRYSKNDKLLSSLEFIQLRILIMLKRKRFEDALDLLDPSKNDIISDIIQKESFVKRAKISYLKGRVLQERCFNKLVKNYEKDKQRKRLEKKRQSARESAKIVITKPILNEFDMKEETEQTPISTDLTDNLKPHHTRGGRGGFDLQNRDIKNNKDINPLNAQSELLLSHSYYRTHVGDPIMQAKCCLELGRTYLEIIMEYFALPKYACNDMQCGNNIIKWLGVKIFNDDATPNNEVITHCLDEIKAPLYQALNLNISETKDLQLLIESYIALAEFEFLKAQCTANVSQQSLSLNSTQTSKNFWQQSKITFLSTYKCSDDWVFLRRIDRHSRLQIFGLFKRILRLLVCFENRFIADNVEIFVSYISLETFMVAQCDIYKSTNAQKKRNFKTNQIPIPKPKQKQFQKKDKIHKSDISKDFSRYNSAAIYRNSYQVNSVENVHEKNKKFRKNEGVKNNYKELFDNMSGDVKAAKIIKNPTITFKINEKCTDILNDISLAADTSYIRPLYPRYRDFGTHSMSECLGEKYLDELFRMHWKMRTESNQFSGQIRIDRAEIDNDASLVNITKCINKLQVSSEELDINCTLNRKYKSWQANETFIISLDSIVFMFHTHTLRKYAINKYKKDELPNYSQLKSFTSLLTNIAFHDSDFLKLEDNPWLNKSANSLSEFEKKEEQKSFEEPVRMRSKQTHLDKPKLELLKNELTLPYLKLESVSELLMCLDPQNILSVLGAIFSECQIILVSKERCRCLAIIDALFVLMYPFSWQYPCIPWLSPACFETLKLPIPYIFGIANIKKFTHILTNNIYDICDKCVICDLDTNNLMKPSSLPYNQLPLKIKSKLTRAMIRLMSALLKNSFKNNLKNNTFVHPPRRRDNMSNKTNRKNITNFYNLLTSPYTSPISICSERKKWYTKLKLKGDKSISNLQKMVITFQKEFCVSWVDVLEQYRLFWVDINSALHKDHKDLKSKSTGRIQKYAHPRYRKFLTEIQKTRMFSSFQCIRSLANTDMLRAPMFDNLVMQSLKWRQSLYLEIIQQRTQEIGKMKVSVENSKKRYFIAVPCWVIFDPKGCKLEIKPENHFGKKDLLPFEVILKATDYEIESDHSVHKLHPYTDPKQVQKYGERYQFIIKHQKDGVLTFNCKNYYELTRWIHMIRTHSMDTWSWLL